VTQSEQAEALRASVIEGTPITLLERYCRDVPTGFSKVVRDDETGQLILADGRLIKFQPHSGGHWMAYREDDDSNSSIEIRPSRSTDHLSMLVHQGRINDEGQEMQNTRRPSRGWAAKHATNAGRLLSLDNHIRVEDFLETTIPNITYANLQVYMNRRFGLPTHEGDPNKSLVGGWMLDTLRERVFMKVEPSISGIEFSIRFYGTPDLAKELDIAKRAIDYTSDPAQQEEPTQRYLMRLAPLTRAARMSMLDLLRPTSQHNINFNVLGPVDDADNFMEFEAGYDVSSIYGLPYDFIRADNAAFSGMIKALRRLNPHDMSDAMRQMANMVEHAMEQTAKTMKMDNS
jgi:hypothetical protein